MRIIVERSLELDLKDLIRIAVAAQPVDADESVADEIYDYVIERMRGYCLEQADTTAEAFDAVRARMPESLADFAARLRAVNAFVSHPAASNLAAANKRIANILRQSELEATLTPSNDMLREEAEVALMRALEDIRSDVAPLLQERAYPEALTRLAELQQPVDAFFDDVMVMAEDERLRQNRLSLLQALREQFLQVADISRLAVK